MATVFFSYSHADEKLRDQIEKQLSLLKRQGIIETWHDRRIGAGEHIHDAIDSHSSSDEIILLLVSPDFIDSDYCYEKEMLRAMQRHHAGQAIVIPVILRPCDWHGAPFGSLNAVPRDGKAITRMPDMDEAMLEVANAVRDAAGRVGSRPTSGRSHQALTGETAPAPLVGPRSSNMRLAKAFTQRDKDAFKLQAFEYITRYFENSLQELGQRNPGCEGVFRQVDANRFFASIYLHGKDVARATIYIGSEVWGRSINYTQGEVMGSNTMNDCLQVEADDQTLYLRTMMGGSFGYGQPEKLSMEGGAEHFWSQLIAPLQQSHH